MVDPCMLRVNSPSWEKVNIPWWGLRNAHLFSTGFARNIHGFDILMCAPLPDLTLVLPWKKVDSGRQVQARICCAALTANQRISRLKLVLIPLPWNVAVCLPQRHILNSLKQQENTQFKKLFLFLSRNPLQNVNLVGRHHRRSGGKNICSALKARAVYKRGQSIFWTMHNSVFIFVSRKSEI